MSRQGDWIIQRLRGVSVLLLDGRLLVTSALMLMRFGLCCGGKGNTMRELNIEHVVIRRTTSNQLIQHEDIIPLTGLETVVDTCRLESTSQLKRMGKKYAFCIASSHGFILK